MNTSDLNPLPEERRAFNLTQYKYVPIASGCYVLANFQEAILYIGQAVNLRNRFQQHLENPEKTKPTKEGKAFWFYFLKYDGDLNKLERTWLNQYEILHGKKPILNKISSPVV